MDILPLRRILIKILLPIKRHWCQSVLLAAVGLGSASPHTSHLQERLPNSRSSWSACIFLSLSHVSEKYQGNGGMAGSYPLTSHPRWEGMKIKVNTTCRQKLTEAGRSFIAILSNCLSSASKTKSRGVDDVSEHLPCLPTQQVLPPESQVDSLPIFFLFFTCISSNSGAEED